MKTTITSLILSILFCLLTGITRSQNPCNLSMVVTTQTFFPNTITTPTSSGSQYLCGENTVVYDTLPIGCVYALVNAGSSLFVKAACNAVHQVWVKSTGTLTIPIGGAGLFSIYLEPGAIFNNLSGYTITTNTCASLTFPQVDCYAALPTAIEESFVKAYGLKTGPNPANDQIHLELNRNDMPVTVSLSNLLGKVIYSRNFGTTDDMKLDINTLENGTYLLNIIVGKKAETKKIIVLH